MAKGLAITFMYIHHLFTFPRRMVDGNYYISLFPTIRPEYDLGYASVICVGMFLFLSGYGLYITFKRKKKKSVNFIVQRLWSFYQVYLFYFLVFVPIGMIFFNNVTVFQSDILRYDFKLLEFLKNLVGISSSYNGEYWFVWLYVGLIIFFPITLYLIEIAPFLLLAFSILLYFSPLSIPSYSGPDLGTIVYWQPTFVIGIYCAKFDIFNKIDSKFLHLLNSITIILICLLLKKRGMPDFILVPPLILCSTSIFDRFNSLKYLMIFLGNYSFPMWLMHTYFCYYYFQWLIYWPKVSILVLLNLMAITIVVGICTEYVRTRSISFVTAKLHFNNYNI